MLHPPPPLRATRLLCTLLLALAAPAIRAAAPVPPAPALDAKTYVLIDAFSRQVIAARGDRERVDPASLTKLMTSYVVFQALQDGRIKLEQEITVSEHAWRAGGAVSDSSTSFLPIGSRVRVLDLVQGMIVQSGNDAAIALAEAVAGNESTFAALMNQYSQRLGLSGSHWTNASGLPAADHYTTARDIAFLGAAIIREFPQYYRWYSERSFAFNGKTQANRNGLLERDPTVDGIKTGHTDAAGYCLAASALRDGMRLVSVVMHSSSTKSREEASEALLTYGFSFYETRRLYSAGQRIGSAHVWKASDPVDLTVAQAVWMTAPRGELAGAQAMLRVTPRLVAPLAANQVLGQLEVAVGQQVVLRAPLVAGKPVPAGGWYRRMLDSVKLWFA